MLSSAALRAGELPAIAPLAGVVLLAVMAAGALWLWRRIRRQPQVLGLALARRAHEAAAGRARRRLWRAVSTAGHAVALTRKAGAPTGDLDAFCRRLRQAAADTGRLLAMASRAAVPSHQPEPVSSQVGDLVLAARGDPGRCGLRCCVDVTAGGEEPADDARGEAVALSAGIASASRAAAGGLPGVPA